jgi:hypothetical protein
VADTAFQVTYDGPALASGRMPVRDLAPALLALGDLFADASALIYPDRKPVALSIEATEQGSFVVRLILETRDRLVDIFGSDAAQALLALKEYIVGAGAGLFWLIKHLRGRRVARHDEPKPGVVRLTLEDGTTVEIPAETFRLYQSLTVRRKARQVVEPLTREGIERLAFEDDRAVTISLQTDEVELYDVPQDAELKLGEHEIPMVVSISSVAFVEGNKWRLTDGDNTFHASIDDAEFIRRVEQGIEAFRKGDMLRVRMQIVQSQRESGLHTDYHVAEVLEHIPTPLQLELGTTEADST